MIIIRKNSGILTAKYPPKKAAIIDGKAIFKEDFIGTLFCLIAGINPANDPNITAKRLVEAAIIGSTPKNIIIGSLTAPKAIPNKPPKKPINKQRINKIKYI